MLRKHWRPMFRLRVRVAPVAVRGSASLSAVHLLDSTLGDRMSFFPAKDPALGNAAQCDAIDLVIVPRTVDLGGMSVRRALPSPNRRVVGHFDVFDHFGPPEPPPGLGLAVR